MNASQKCINTISPWNKNKNFTSRGMCWQSLTDISTETIFFKQTAWKLSNHLQLYVEVPLTIVGFETVFIDRHLLNADVHERELENIISD